MLINNVYCICENAFRKITIQQGEVTANMEFKKIKNSEIILLKGPDILEENYPVKYNHCKFFNYRT